MKLRGSQARPVIPMWVADFRHWHEHPSLPVRERHQLHGRLAAEWLDRYGYDVFDQSDATVAAWVGEVW